MLIRLFWLGLNNFSTIGKISLKNDCLLHTCRRMTRLANASSPNMLTLSCLQRQWVSSPGQARSNKVMDVHIHVNQYNFIISQS